MLIWIHHALATWGRIVPNHGAPIKAPVPVPVPVRTRPRR